MNKQYLKQFCLDKIAEYPDLKSEITDFYFLAMDDMYDGGSEMHEVESAINSINELINENK
jgi:hypothetical protein